MKQCCTCHVVLPVGAFARRRASPDGLQARCKACFAQQYADARVPVAAAARARSHGTREEKLQKLAQVLTERPCVDCGERDLRVLDFDHRDPVTKRSGIAQMLTGSWSWRAVLEEVEKCDVRCANCHRRRTASTQGWWKHARQQELEAIEAKRSTARLTTIVEGHRGQA